MKTKTKSKSSAPQCVFCHRSGSGVQFNIFTPRFAPFGTACTDCEASLPPDTRLPEPYMGRYARSVESGWLGKVVSVESSDGQTLCRMQGVNELYRTLKGGDIEDAIDADDVQWFTPEDLKFITLK